MTLSSICCYLKRKGEAGEDEEKNREKTKRKKVEFGLSVRTMTEAWCIISASPSSRPPVKGFTELVGLGSLGGLGFGNAKCE